MPESLLQPIEGDPFLEPVEGNPFSEAGIVGNVSAATQKLLGQEAARRVTLGQLVSHWTLPGRLARGVQLADPSTLTEEDAYHLNQLNDLVGQWGPEQALTMLKAGITQRGMGAAKVFEDIAKQPKVPPGPQESPKSSFVPTTLGIRG
jgi:hypothetical protein